MYAAGRETLAQQGQDVAAADVLNIIDHAIDDPAPYDDDDEA